MLRVFITLFNLQGARRPAKLRYDIMPFSFCQALFSSFFELFQCLHPQGLLTCHHRILSNPAALSQALGYIITCSFTCQALFSDSWNLFQCRPALKPVTRALSSARLSYQRGRILSIDIFSKGISILCPFFYTFIRNFKNSGIWNSGKKKNRMISHPVCVGVTYLSGPSPGKYCRQKWA